MAAATTSSPAQRATLLIGYGQFGLDVLRRLLVSAASRGVLTWEQPRGPADAGERHLQDLELLWVNDPFDTTSQGIDPERAAEGGTSEVLRDLYRQIQAVGEQPEPELALAEAMRKATNRLLDAAARAGRQQILPLGLDVIVLARPDDPVVIGRLTHLLFAGISQIENYANLKRALPGAEILNFIQILDFENYWDSSVQGHSVRTAVYNSVIQWQQRRERGRAAFGRIYLVDGKTADGNRSESHRIDETSLFLEFLLFEGQRSGELQRLYQSPGAQESPVATFGIRLLERSAGLLSRLAAAWFGINWLDYLTGAEVPHPERRELSLYQYLQAYHPAELNRRLGSDALRDLLQARLTALEQELVRLPVTDSDWPEQIGDRYQAAARQLETELLTQVHARMKAADQEQLAALPAELRTRIQEDLHHVRRPVSLGVILYELKVALAELDLATSRPAESPTVTVVDSLQQLHDRYSHFKSGQLDPEGLRQWWPLFALLLSIGLTPVVTELLRELPAPDPAAASFLLVNAYRWSRWLANPIATSILLFGMGWLFGALVGQPCLRGWIQRARRFWDDPERGRLSGRLRAELQPRGTLHQPLAILLERTLQDMALGICGEVKRALAYVADRLQQRRQEMRWLQGQLQKFLELHGLRLEGLQGELGRLERDSSGIRHALERQQDFQRMLNTNPPTPERFLSIQAERQPFSGWDEYYSSTFLYPLDFIDELSYQYQDPLLEELARPGSGPEQQARAREFREFLDRHGNFALAFSWQVQTGVPGDRRYCLLPKTWLELPGIRDELLMQLRIPGSNILEGTDVARAYLLAVQTGVEPSCLLD